MNDLPDPQGRFDADAVERILRRALEIEHGEQALDGGGISARALEQAAEELGVEPQYVRAAIVEEDLGLLQPSRQRLESFIGPGRLLAYRTVPFDPPQAFASLDQWLTRSLGFRRAAEGAGSASYVRRKDMVASLRRSTGKLVGAPDLQRLMTLDVRVSADRPGRSILVLDADVAIERTINVAIATGVAGIGSAASVVGASLLHTVAVPFAGVPFSFGLSAYVTYVRGRAVAQMRTELTRVLELAAGGPPPTVGQSVGSAARRLFGKTRD